jgi:hypothetical protein
MLETPHAGSTFELLCHEPFGSSFLLSLVNEHDEVIARSELAPRYARLLWVMDDAPDDGTDPREWCGFMTAEDIGRKYSDLAGSAKPLGIGGVRALVFELRKLITQNFDHTVIAPKLIETKKLLGYRIPPGLLKIVRR